MCDRLRLLGWVFVLPAALLALAGGCQRPLAAPQEDGPAGPAWFADVAKAAGLNFVHDAAPLPREGGRYFMPQSIGSGAALFDFDGDGLLDIYLLHNGGPGGRKNQLFKQLPNGTFKDVSQGSGLDIAGHCMGVAIGDVNNDGRPDVLVTRYGGIHLFLNNGDGTFSDISKEAGLNNPSWGVSAAFVDYDRDGWLDLVVVNYVDYDPTWSCPAPSGAPEYCGPSAFPSRASRLFRNLGAGHPGRGVRFQDVTVSSGLGRAAGPGLGVVCADFDGDGWPDIFIANDGKPNHLWINRRDGTFAEQAVQRGLAFNGMGIAQAGMGVALGDVDGDGRFDLVVTHMPEENNTLWRQEVRGIFRDQTVGGGLARTRWRGTGFGTALGDFDNDGALDLAVVNGRVFKAPSRKDPSLGEHWGWYAEKNQLFTNDGAGHFRDVSARERDLCGTPNVARGLACGDVFNDGSLALLVTMIAGPTRLYRNVAPGRGHWLLVRALDPAHGGRDAYGAEVRVRAGGRSWVRWVNPAGSYLCSNDPRAHFGLGTAERVDAIDVLWPDGRTETFPGGPTDCVRVVRQGTGDKETRRQGDKETGR